MQEYWPKATSKRETVQITDFVQNAPGFVYVDAPYYHLCCMCMRCLQNMLGNDGTCSPDIQREL